MRIISRKTIREFTEKHPESTKVINTWYKIVGCVQAANIHELKKTFNSIDVVSGYIVFDIAGNKYRLIAAIHFNKQKLYIRKIWTHQEYTEPANQKALMKGLL